MKRHGMLVLQSCHLATVLGQAATRSRRRQRVYSESMSALYKMVAQGAVHCSMETGQTSCVKFKETVARMQTAMTRAGSRAKASAKLQMDLIRMINVIRRCKGRKVCPKAKAAINKYVLLLLKYRCEYKTSAEARKVWS